MDPGLAQIFPSLNSKKHLELDGFNEPKETELDLDPRT